MCKSIISGPERKLCKGLRQRQVGGEKWRHLRQVSTSWQPCILTFQESMKDVQKKKSSTKPKTNVSCTNGQAWHFVDSEMLKHTNKQTILLSNAWFWIPIPILKKKRKRYLMFKESLMPHFFLKMSVLDFPSTHPYNNVSICYSIEMPQEMWHRKKSPAGI